MLALLLSLLPLAVSLGIFGGTPDRLTLGFLPFQSPPEEPDLGRAATVLVEATHARFREEGDAHFSLVGPSETQRFRDSRDMPETLGRRIGADVVLAGGLRPVSAEIVLLSAALIRVEDGRAIWSGELEIPRDVPPDRSYALEWLWNRVRRTMQGVRVPR